MGEKCNLLILTARFGDGHISVANAIREHALSADSGYKVKIFDICDVLIPEKADLMYKCYDAMVKRAPYVYNYTMYHGLADRIYKRIRQMSGDKYLENFDKVIKENEPDAILSVFPVCTDAASVYKESYESDIPLFTCITDVVDSDEWLHPNNDMYFIPHQSMADKLVRKGVPPEKIMATGIPVRKEFYEKRDRCGMKELLGYKKDDFVIIIMGGGLGRIPDNLLFYRWLDRRRSVRTVIITARNARMNRNLRMMRLKNCRIFEYIDEISDYMNAADLIVSKGGGVTLFESIVSRLPMIVYRPELNQELENSRFISSQGIGSVSRNIGDLKRTIKAIMAEGCSEKMMDSIRLLSEEIHTGIMIEKIMEAKMD
jgi:processive 1,2-diacylglycerol beta-glucosyltransferase